VRRHEQTCRSVTLLGFGAAVAVFVAVDSR